MSLKEQPRKDLKFRKSRKQKSVLKNKLKEQLKNYDGTDENTALLEKIAKSLSSLYVNEPRSDKIASNDTKLNKDSTDYTSYDRFASFVDEVKSDEDSRPPRAGDVSKEKIKSLTRLESFERFGTNFENNVVETTVDDKMEEIRELLRQNSVVLIQGDTGCGKTTKIPRMLMDEYQKIVCTQPRRLAAINVARKVSKDLGCKLGSDVGYAVRFEDVSSPKTKLKFVTDGILLQELGTSRTFIPGIQKNIEKIAGYDLIIIDEAHERTINIDFLLGYFKKVLSNKKMKTKILIMSATINAEVFNSFFGCKSVVISHKIHTL